MYASAFPSTSATVANGRRSYMCSNPNGMNIVDGSLPADAGGDTLVPARSTAMRRFALVLAGTLLTGCGGDKEEQVHRGPPARAVKEVWTTFYPTTYFAKRIAGDTVKVVCPLPESEDPAFWKPD